MTQYCYATPSDLSDIKWHAVPSLASAKAQISDANRWERRLSLIGNSDKFGNNISVHAIRVNNFDGEDGDGDAVHEYETCSQRHINLALHYINLDISSLPDLRDFPSAHRDAMQLIGSICGMQPSQDALHSAVNQILYILRHLGCESGDQIFDNVISSVPVSQ